MTEYVEVQSEIINLNKALRWQLTSCLCADSHSWSAFRIVAWPKAANTNAVDLKWKQLSGTDSLNA
jgi:hypothetical protein